MAYGGILMGSRSDGLGDFFYRFHLRCATWFADVAVDDAALADGRAKEPVTITAAEYGYNRYY